MALFSFGKKKEEQHTPACACQCGCSVPETTEITIDYCCEEAKSGICCVKVLGAGCKFCHEQYENAKKAVLEMGLDIEVEYITDMEKVMAYSVMSMPALVVNEQVMAIGKVLKPAEIVKILEKVSG